MAIQGLAIFLVGLRTARTGNLFRRKEVCPIKGDQQGAVDRAKPIEIAIPVQLVADRRHEREQRFRRHRIEQITNLVVAGNLMDPKERCSVVLALLLLHPDLAIEKRRALGEEYREGRKRRIGHFIVLVVALASCVGQHRKSHTDPLNQNRGAQGRRGWAND